MRKPKNKKELTLYFDTEQGIRNFIAWYTDGGGEQNSSYYSETCGKNWMYVKPPEDCCPKCEYVDQDNIQTYLWNNKKIKEIDWNCENCSHAYTIANYYS
jgi:hypothetical protein